MTGHGIVQFVDAGSGLRASPATHEAAGLVSPDARVVYLDNDPVAAVPGDVRRPARRSCQRSPATPRA